MNTQNRSWRVTKIGFRTRSGAFFLRNLAAFSAQTQAVGSTLRNQAAISAQTQAVGATLCNLGAISAQTQAMGATLRNLGHSYVWLSLDDHLLYLLNIYRGKIGEWFVENTEWRSISKMRGTNRTPHYYCSYSISCFKSS